MVSSGRAAANAGFGLIPRSPSLGILAYGSLIDDPGSELMAATIEIFRDVETPFPVEFARSSRTRGGGPTLVPVAEGGRRVRGAIIVLDATAEAGADMLWRRETRAKDGSRGYVAPVPGETGRVRVERIEHLGGVDLALYTSIDPNIVPLTASRLADLAIESVSHAEPGMDGISYLIAATRNGIVTGLSDEYASEILVRAGATSLEHALTTIRDR